MKLNSIMIISFAAILLLAGCGQGGNTAGNSRQSTDTVQQTNEKQMENNIKSGYASLKDLKMYYEIHGSGEPLVLIHGGGSTIESNWGRILPLLAAHYQVIAVELQAHGRTPDRDRPTSFQQDADDVADLLKILKIDSADFFGFSNGGHTVLQIAISHPQIVRKLIIASAFYKKEGAYPWLWDLLKHSQLENMPQGLKDAYLKVTPDSNGLLRMHDRDRDRMNAFKDWSDKDIQSIKAPTLIMIGDQDVTKPEHAVAMYRMFPHARLVILPGIHGAFLGEIVTWKPGDKTYEFTASLVRDFLDSAQ